MLGIKSFSDNILDTPFLSALKKTKAQNTKHEFITDDLTAAANNAQLEGDTFAAGARPTPVRLWNRTQISYKVSAVSRTQQASNPYGMKNMLAYNMANVAKELFKMFRLRTPVMAY